MMEELSEEETLPHLSQLIRTYLSTMDDLGAETWIMHGTLLAWWWNQKPTIHFLDEYYNMTEHHFDIPGVEGGRTYLLEINPNYVFRSIEDKKNVIDARWIDTSSGLFIDITAVRPDDAKRKKGDTGALMCKDKHHFDVSSLRSGLYARMADSCLRKMIYSRSGIVTLKTSPLRFPSNMSSFLKMNMDPRP
ncbi:unnamed protein product [Aspergillus oryzae]|nr:unnamed protein product [Aspergillus oryzae]GMF92411.1 unnamed protein product [Aspergillus oryzae]